MKSYQLLTMCACLLMVFFQLGCATTDNIPLQDLRIGMNKNEVRQLAGEPDSIKQASKDEAGKNVELWHYSLRTEEYLLRFKGDNLAWWGHKEDWILPSDYSGRTIEEEESTRYQLGLEEAITN